MENKSPRPLLAFKIIFALTIFFFGISFSLKSLYTENLTNEISAFALRIADISTLIILSLFLRVQNKFEKGHENIKLLGAAVYCIAFFSLLSILRYIYPTFEWEITFGCLFAGIILNLGWLLSNEKIIKFTNYYPIVITSFALLFALFQIINAANLENPYLPSGEFKITFMALNFLGGSLIFGGCVYYYLLSRAEKNYWAQALVFYFAIIGLTRFFIAFSENKDMQFVIGSLRFGSNVTAVYYLVWAYQHTLQELILEAKKNEQNQRVIEEQRAKMFHSAQMASITKLSGVFAHEINNPIASISLNAEFMLRQDKGTLTTDQANRIYKILGLTKRISEIIKRFLALSQINEHRGFYKTPLKDIIAETIDVCGSTLSTDMQFTVDTIPDVMIEGNPSQISQALLNLLLNSFDAVKRLDQKWVHIYFERLHDEVLIKVVDSGKGIPSEIAGRIMDPFFTTKDVNEGPGLGLSISKTYVEENHGHLYYDDHSPNTCFVIELPIAGIHSRPSELS